MSTPGALTSGFSSSEIGVGPPLENDATASCLLTAATVIALAALPGEEMLPYPEVGELVPGRDRRDDAGGGGRVDRRDDEVPRWLDLRLAERQVDDVHAVADGRLDPCGDLGRVPVQPEVLGRDGQHLVVAEICVRRDARERAAVGDRARRVVAGGDPGDMGRVLRVGRVEGGARVLPRVRGRRERPRDDHLRGRVPRIPLREAGRHRVAARVEEPVRLVDAVVDDADLDPVARRVEQRCVPELVGADQLRAAVEQRPVGDARPDLRDARNGGEPPELRARDDDGEAVEHDLVAPGDAGAGDGGGDARGERALRGRERAEVRDARRCAQVQPLGLEARAQDSAALDRLGEGRRLERDDDLDAVGRRSVRGRREENGGHRRREKKASFQVENVRRALLRLVARVLPA